MSTLEKDIPLHVRLGTRSLTKSVVLALMKSRDWTTLNVEKMISWGNADKLPVARESSFKEWLEAGGQSLEECVRVLAAVVEAGAEKSEPASGGRSALPPDLQKGSSFGPRTQEPYTFPANSTELADGKEDTAALEWRLKQATLQAACASVIEEVSLDPEKAPEALALFEAQLAHLERVQSAIKAKKTTPVTDPDAPQT